jgi:hypothetical protein
MKTKPKTDPFDLALAKTPENPTGRDVVTTDSDPVKIIYTNRKSSNGYGIVALVDINGEERVVAFGAKGISNGVELRLAISARQAWINVYHNIDGSVNVGHMVYSSKVQAYDGRDMDAPSEQVLVWEEEI